MEKPQIVGPSRDELEAHEASGSRRRWSATPNRVSTPERKINELITAIHSMTSAMHSMQKQMLQHWGEDEDPESRRTPQRHDKRDRRGFRQDQDEGEAQ